MPSPQNPVELIEHRIGADLCTGNMRIAPAADGQVDRDVPHERTVHRLASLIRLASLLCRLVDLQSRELKHRLHNLRCNLLDRFCHASFRNIVHDNNFVPKTTKFRLRRLLSGVETHVACKHNSPCYVEFSVAASAKGGTEIKIGSHVMLVPKYSSVQHPLAQMVLYARNKFDGTFACLKSMTPKSIFDMAKRLCSSASPNVCGADWISARPKSESPKLQTDSEFTRGKSFGSRNQFAENESHPRSEHGIKEGKAKTPADWVVATAAPHHATGNHNLLSGFVIEHDDQFIHAVDGISMKVFARGAVVTDTMVLPDVWFVPGLKENLVSVSQLAELDYSIGFGFGECCVRSAANGKIMGKGHLQDHGQYVLDFLKVPLAI